MNPKQFDIMTQWQYPSCTLYKIYYPDCGIKIIVTIEPHCSTISFDSHFTKEGNIIAHFEPSQRGYDAAHKFCEVYR